MTDVTIYLTPALDGVTSEVGYFFNDQWIKVINAPASVAGIIGTFGIVTGIDFAPLHIFIPSQTIGGVTYEEALSQGWMETASTFTDNITLIEVAPPPPPPPPPIEIKSIVIPGILGIVLMFLLRG